MLTTDIFVAAQVIIVSYDRELDEDSLRRAIEWIDFSVTGIGIKSRLMDKL